MTMTSAQPLPPPTRSLSLSSTSCNDAPNEYICPISLEVMKHPVMDRNGNTFEKSAILEWLNRGNTHCPLTRQPLKPSALIPNYSLKLSIDTWVREHMNEINSNSSSRNLRHDENDDDDDDQPSFVGLVSCPPEAFESTNISSHEDDADLDDDLSDLLALYNEVLELTSAPLDSPLLRGGSTSTASSQPWEQQQQQQRATINMEEPVNAAVQRSLEAQRQRQQQQQQPSQQNKKNRRWPLTKVFNKSNKK